MESLLQDVRQAIRSLRRTPGFTAAAVASLALGIGANSTIFSVVSAVLVRPLPYREAGQLYSLRGQQSRPDLTDVRDASSSFAAVGGFGGFPADLATPSGPEQVQAALVSGDLFGALGVRSAQGRALLPEDDARGAAPVVVISDAFLRTRLSGRTDAVGSSLTLSGKTYVVAGVMPPGFRLPEGDSQLWLPLNAAYPEAADARGAHLLVAVLRLSPAVAREAAQAQLATLGRSLQQRYPEHDKDQRFPLQLLQDRVTHSVRGPLLLLLGAVGLLLLVACANFANLLLARGAGRRHELAVRAALGASRARLLRHLLTESTLLALLGGAAGLLLAAWLLPPLLALDPESLPRLASVELDARVFAFTLGVSLFTGLVFGLLPALQVSRLQLHGVLQEAAPTAAARGILRSLLVVGELALAVVLLAGAGLLLRSLVELQRAPLGFQPQGVLTLRVDLPGSRYSKIAAQTDLFDRVLAGVLAQPGVAEVGMVTELPLDGTHVDHNLQVEGAAPVKVGDEPEVGARIASPGYFRALQIPLLQGRLFEAADGASAPLVAVVNQRFARQLLAGKSALGARVRWAREARPDYMTVIGVVGDTRHDGLEEEQPPTLYVPYAQNTNAWHRWQNLVVRPRAGSPLALAAAVKAQVFAGDPQLPVTRVRLLDEVVAGSLALRRFQLVLLSLFAALALVLGAVGIYGVVAYSVAQRTRELGLRLALGATRRQVVSLVVAHGLRLSLGGIALGLPGSLLLARLLSSTLYGVTPADVPTHLGIALLLGAVALAASYLPARRAARIEPMVALRQ